MPKPKGTTGATKMKILAIVHHNSERGSASYGYSIWQDLKTYFHIYLDVGDTRNVYHHLKTLCAMDLLAREEDPSPTRRCLYRLTERGRNLRGRYERYLKIVRGEAPPS